MTTIFRLLFLLNLLFVSSHANTRSYDFEFIGEVTFQTGYKFQENELGGLSGITYDAKSNVYYCISDDASERGPARFYTLKIDVSDGRLQNGDIQFEKVTYLKNSSGQLFAKNTIDAEGIAFFDGTLFISSEGSANAVHPPFISRFDLSGNYQGSLNIPAKFMPTAKRDYGIGSNRGFESLAITPDGKYLFSVNETALAQDGPEADFNVKSPVRIMRFAMNENVDPKEFLYWVDPVHTMPSAAEAFRTNGLVDMIAIDEFSLLTMERSFVAGAGSTNKIFDVSLEDADGLEQIERLDKINLDDLKTAHKTLIYDLAQLQIKLDNIEGITFGQTLPDGRRAVILVGDNNFSEVQVTQFLAFAVSQKLLKPQSPTIPEIQGESHFSPFKSQKLTGIAGIVTGLSTSKRNSGFWMQTEGDGNPKTSDGIFVSTAGQQINVNPGDVVKVDGTVEESGEEDLLPVTRIIVAAKVNVLSSGNKMPGAIVIGNYGRKQPAQIDDDQLTKFEPQNDAIDFYESLEGMRVAVQNPVVVGPTNNYGEFFVLPDNGEDAGIRTARGGIVLRPGDFNPERVMIQITGKNKPALQTGDSFKGTITGILDYSFANYKIVTTEPLPELVKNILEKEVTSLIKAKNLITVASYNVENLDFKDGVNKYAAVAKTIVENLKAPDIIALQEIQDNNGPDDDGTVSAAKTLRRLIGKIKEFGGPAYDFCQINPRNNKEGGQPGGNIRVVYLYNPERIGFKRRGSAKPEDSVNAKSVAGEVRLNLNPGRIYPATPAFKSGRGSLAAEFIFNGHKIFIINNHLKSKLGDDRIYGLAQPPVFHTETKRAEQTRILAGFVGELLALDDNANIIVLGDMNEQEFRKPLQVLGEKNLINLIDRLAIADRYTYIFDGNSQVLDHIFISSNLVKQSQPEIDIVHINAEFPDSQRASDHEAVVARFKF